MIPQRLRILFSEDDPDTREMICILLDEEGIDVSCPDSAEHALDLARLERFDAYVLDNWMPDMSGIDLCRGIREFDSKTPVIFYSAAAFDEDKNRALACGAKAYISKPASIDTLAGAIRSAIQEKDFSATPHH